MSHYFPGSENPNFKRAKIKEMQVNTILNSLSENIFKDNQKKGFWPEEWPESTEGKDIPTILILIIEEVIEAHTAFRSGRKVELKEKDIEALLSLPEADRVKELERLKGNVKAAPFWAKVSEDEFSEAEFLEEEEFKKWFDENVKGSIEDELADVFIRCFDFAGGYGINIHSHIFSKLRRNRSRPYKHGKRY